MSKKIMTSIALVVLTIALFIAASYVSRRAATVRGAASSADSTDFELQQYKQYMSTAQFCEKHGQDDDARWNYDMAMISAEHLKDNILLERAQEAKRRVGEKQ